MINISLTKLKIKFFFEQKNSKDGNKTEVFLKKHLIQF